MWKNSAILVWFIAMHYLAKIMFPISIISLCCHSLITPRTIITYHPLTAYVHVGRISLHVPTSLMVVAVVTHAVHTFAHIRTPIKLDSLCFNRIPFSRRAEMLLLFSLCVATSVASKAYPAIYCCTYTICIHEHSENHRRTRLIRSHTHSHDLCGRYMCNKRSIYRVPFRQ